MEKPPRSAAPRVFTAAPAAREQLRLLKSGAPGARHVLICGEAGSGRSFWAALYHRHSGESGPAVIADCALLGADLFEAQLFGVARGAATGVAAHPGLVGRAAGGLLVLDRLELLDFSLQAKLLRLLDSGEYTPLGGAPAQAQLRVAALVTTAEGATPQSLIRPDLFYRLSGLTLRLPPLRERAADLTPFVHEFMQRAGRPPQSVKPAVLLALKNHPLPGNLRELEAVLAGAITQAGRRRIDLKHLPASYSAPWPARPPTEASADAGAALPTLESVEREHVLRVLGALEGNRSAAARVLGISRKSLWERLARWGLGEGAPPAAGGGDDGPPH